MSESAASNTKTSLRRSSTSCVSSNAAAASTTAVANGAAATESSSRSSAPALRQRSASMGKMADTDGSSKRKRDPSPQPSSSPEPDSPTPDVSDTLETISNDTPVGTSDAGPLSKRRKSIKSENDLANDIYCWVCHKEFVTGQPISYCKTCPRSYHTRCIANMEGMIAEPAATLGEQWACPECRAIDRAENVLFRSQAMQLLSLDQFCTLLKFSVGRMKAVVGADPFLKPVETTDFPQYSEYVVNPMDLSQLERNLRRKQYGSTEAFLADTKWILHNSVIFNTCQAKLTSAARTIVKVCRQEMAEIENCPDCYLNAHTRKESWFIEVCRRPHMLVWAKLKGFPFWPAKAMKVNKESAVDVRFFGAHDRAWVPVRDCFLYSREMPAAVKQKKRNNLESCIEEVEQHTTRLKERFGAFSHAPARTPFDPEQQEKQLNMLLPNYQPGVDGKRARTILHPEISPSSRTPGKAAASGTSTPSTTPILSEKQPDKTEKQSPAVAIATTVFRSARLASTSKTKTLYPVVLIKKQDQHSIIKKQAEEEESESSKNEDEEESGSKVSDNSADSSFEESVNAGETDKKLAEEEAISAIIKATKAMEETLGQTVTQKPLDNAKVKDEFLEQNSENSSDNKMEVEEEEEKKATSDQETCESPIIESTESTPSIILKLASSSPLSSPDLNKEFHTENEDPLEDTDSDSLAESSVVLMLTPALEKLEPSKPESTASADSTNSSITTSPDKIPMLNLSVSDEKALCDSKAVETDNPSPRELKEQNTVSEDDSSDSEPEESGASKVAEAETAPVKVLSSATPSEPPPSESSEGEEDEEESESETEHVEEPGETTDQAAVKTPEATKQDRFVPKISIKLLKPINMLSKQKESDVNLKVTSDSATHVVSITSEPPTPRDKNRSIPALISTDRKTEPLNEVQITRVEKLKRKLPDTSSNSLKTNESSSGSSELSSDSESEQNTPETNSVKKKKTEDVVKKVVKQARRDSGDPMDTDNLQNSPRPSNTDDDSIFPSLFLDPSVTITVVENTSEKKTTSSTADVSAKELCNSVKLSSDVSLTIVEKSKSSPEKQSHSSSPSPAPSTIAEVSSTSKKPLPSLKLKSKARKSFAPPPKQQLISVRNPSSMLANGNRSPPVSEPQHLGSSMQKELLVTAIQGARASNNSMSGVQQHQQQHQQQQQQQQQHQQHQQQQHQQQQHPPPPPHSHRSLPHPPGHGQLLPQLHPRPFTGHMVSGPPSEAGPATAELNKHASKLTEYVRQSLETLMRDLSALGSPQASIGAMQLEIERLQWRHQQEMAELKHNADLVVLEMRASMESERVRTVAEVRRQAEMERQRAVEETKKKQWCAYCNKEALFYCCWNTSYCDYPCQQAHWPRHMATCAQKYSKDGSSSNIPQVSNAPKAAAYHGTTRLEGADAAAAAAWLAAEQEEELPPSPPNSSSSSHKSSKWAGKRKRCGHCEGCAVTRNCGVCAPCKNSRTHQVCRERRCRTLEESEHQRWLSSQSVTPTPNVKKTPQNKGLPPNVPLTQQQLVSMTTSAVMSGGRAPQHFTIVPRPMQGGGMPQFAMFPAGGSPRPPMGSQTSHVAFPMQPHFFM